METHYIRQVTPLYYIEEINVRVIEDLNNTVGKAQLNLLSVLALWKDIQEKGV